MSGKTLTRLDLAEAVARNCGLRKAESVQLVDDILEAIMDGLFEDGVAKISGFATFTVKSKAARVGRNPKTGVEKPIPARQVIAFRASHNMKANVDAGNRAKGT